jgi:hypothetical protein
LAIPLFSVFVVSRLGLGEYPSDAMDTDPQSDVRGYQGTTDISRHQTTTSPAPVLRPHISEQQHQANIFALEQEHGREKVQMQQDHTERLALNDATLRNEYESNMANLKTQYELRMSTLSEKLGLQEQQLRQQDHQHNEAVSIMEQRRQSDIEAVMQQHVTFQQQGRMSTQQLEAQHQADIEALKQHHVAQEQQNRVSMQQQHQTDISQLQEQQNLQMVVVQNARFGSTESSYQSDMPGRESTKRRRTDDEDPTEEPAARAVEPATQVEPTEGDKVAKKSTVQLPSDQEYMLLMQDYPETVWEGTEEEEIELGNDE